MPMIPYITSGAIEPLKIEKAATINTTTAATVDRIATKFLRNVVMLLPIPPLESHANETSAPRHDGNKLRVSETTQEEPNETS